MAGDGPLVVREKIHPASPMTLDQALYEMELVGHDFYLFVDKENERPSVVYRRRGYDYGVISLDVELSRRSAPEGPLGGRAPAGWPIWVTPDGGRMPRSCTSYRPLVP